MFHPQSIYAAAVLALIAISSQTGCGESHEAVANHAGGAPAARQSAGAHDPDDVPITEADVQMPATYAEAIERIKSYRDQIRRPIEAGTPGKAHRPLDELDIVLGKLTAIARDSGVPREQWEQVNSSARELRHLFNQVHTAIDEGARPDYASVARPIDEAIERLEEGLLKVRS